MSASRPPDKGGTSRETNRVKEKVDKPVNVLSYADRLKTNVKFDQRLKRNVLEIEIEKVDKEADIVLSDDLVARVTRSIGLDISSQIEGYQVQYGRTPVIHVWCSPGVDVMKYCFKESISISKGISTGRIRPAGKRDVMVSVTGLNFNTPDSLVQKYIKKFGGRLVTEQVIYGKFSEGPFTGKYNGDRHYQVDFSDAHTSMGSYHILDGHRIRVNFKGNIATCGRCHAIKNHVKVKDWLNCAKKMGVSVYH